MFRAAESLMKSVSHAAACVSSKGEVTVIEMCFWNPHDDPPILRLATPSALCQPGPSGDPAEAYTSRRSIRHTGGGCQLEQWPCWGVSGSPEVIATSAPRLAARDWYPLTTIRRQWTGRWACAGTGHRAGWRRTVAISPRVTCSCGRYP